MKEALALAGVGYHITILTAIYSDDLYREDLSLLAGQKIRYEIYSDLRQRNFRSFKARLIKRAALYMKKLGIESIYLLGYDAYRLKKTIALRRAGLYIMHQELATVIGSVLVKNQRVAFDMEDWYSEDLLSQAYKTRPIKLLKNAEKTAIETGAACYTTSIAMAKTMQSYYRTLRQPAVIYNSFNYTESIVRQPRQDILQLYWFSQTIGEGRGLEFFIKCMAESTTRCRLSLRGIVTEAYQANLSKLITAKDSIEFLPMLKNNEIQADMIKYDVGLALELEKPPNKYLTISNKLFHYMAAGLPVIASHTMGQLEIARQCPGLIFLYKQNQSHELIEILNIMGIKLQNNELTGLKRKMLEHYRSKFSWQIEVNKLVKLIKTIY
ncbi:hypothetical protein [Mucilaginibacter aquaedulcis]|uniref:hypothetical protein n=1 Tax=Mucilaginibacter aquaedulcis TaxID=1187081 RepID=UPI0025B51BA7|nr:hypothetical protein [Mucilaginibacter aquaedulcis]MDN3548742.1 hypothetical protein [Mucilaginibacter aquaedulcis]